MVKLARWTEEEEKLLGTMPDAELSKLMGRSVAAVAGRRHKLRITDKPKTKWTPDKEILLGTKPDVELAALWGTTPGAIRARRSLRGIRLPSQRVTWTAEMNALLGTMPDIEIAKARDILLDRVTRQRQRKGIPKYPAGPNRELFKRSLRICSTCYKVKPIEKFAQHPDGRNGYCAQCKECNANRNRARLQAIKTRWVDAMGGKCCRCGYNEFLPGLAFHHIQKKGQDWRGSQLTTWPEDKLAKELDRCALLCHCCHAALHANQLEIKFIRRDGLGWTVAKENEKP